jgi:hypothetical protein
MTFNINFVISGNESLAANYSYVKMHLKLNALSEFTINLSQPLPWQTTDIVGDTEVKIVSGNHAVNGYVKNYNTDTTQRTKFITGYDYSIKLTKMKINTDNVTQEDATISSGYKVYYTNKAFAVIAADLITNSGFTVGSIDTYPVAGPDTNMTMRFEYLGVWGGIKELSNVSNTSNITYDYWINTSKELYLKSRRGSATPVYDLNDGINCKVTNKEGDTIRQAKRIIVLGNGKGSAQNIGTYPTSGFTAGDPEEVYNYTGNDQTVLDSLAQNLFNGYGTELTWITLTVNDSNANIQLGDAVYFQSKELSINQTEYRVIELIKEGRPGKDSLTLKLNIGAKNDRKKTVSEILAENKGLIKYTGTVSQGSISTLVFDTEYNASNTNKAQLSFNLSATLIKSASNLLGARLTVKRTPIRFDTGTATGNSITGVGVNNAASTSNTGVNNAASTSNTGVNNTSAGGTSVIASTSNTGTAIGAVAKGGWVTILDFGTHTASDTSKLTMMAKVWLYASGAGNFGSYFRILVNNTTGYPSAGIHVSVISDNTYYPQYGKDITLIAPVNCNNYNIKLQVYLDNGGISATEGLVTAYYISEGLHIHNNTIADANHTNNNTIADANHTNNNTIADANHANPITQTVNEPGGEANHTIMYDYDGVNKGNWSNVAVNTENAADLITYLTTLGAHYIDIYPSTATQGRYKITLEVDFWNEE